MIKNVLITGAGSFVGNPTTKALIQDDLNVFSVTRNLDRFSNEIKLNLQGSEVLQFDLARIENFPKKIKIDAVVHFAGLYSEDSDDMDALIRSNIVATQNILEFSKIHNVQKFIHISSQLVHGEVEKDFIDEETPSVNPKFYGSTKLIAEKLVLDSKMNTIILRLPSILGKNAKHHWIAKTLQGLKNQESVSAFHPNGQYNNALHRDDLARFIKSIIGSEKFSKDILTLGSEGRMTIESILEKMKETLGSESKINWKEGSQKSFFVDISKAKKQFNFKPMEITSAIQKYLLEESAEDER